MTQVGFTCNGIRQVLADPGDELLIDVLRQELGLTGTKLGCGTGDCGACTVLHVVAARLPGTNSSTRSLASRPP